MTTRYKKGDRVKYSPALERLYGKRTGTVKVLCGRRAPKIYVDWDDGERAGDACGTYSSSLRLLKEAK